MDSSGDDFAPIVGPRKSGSLVLPLVLGGVVVAAVLGGLWLKKSGADSSTRTAMVPSATTSASATTAPTAAVVPAVSPASASAESTAAPDASAAPSASAASDEPPPSTDFDAIRKEFVELHSRRQLKESEALARTLISLRPTDATGYRCLGAALQDQGRMREARATYSDCVSNASEGDVAECAQLGGTLRSVKD
jgi:hypothetical protein